MALLLFKGVFRKFSSCANCRMYVLHIFQKGTKQIESLSRSKSASQETAKNHEPNILCKVVLI